MMGLTLYATIPRVTDVRKERFSATVLPCRKRGRKPAMQPVGIPEV